MLHIHHAEPDAPHPSKAYADACWRADLRLSPDWWREANGYTIGKVALDWRATITQPEHLNTGCNLILTSPATWPQIHTHLVTLPNPQAFMVVLITANLTTLPDILPAFLLWHPPTDTTPQQRQQALTILESLTRDGQIEAYGLALTDLSSHPLHLWLEDAATAAEITYNRRKRPALRLLAAPLDLLDLTLLTAPLTQHKQETVSTLELAARLSLTVIAIPSVLPSETPPAPDAIAALTFTAQTEHALNQHLGGWPMVNGQPLFSVLAHLSAGQSPWPSPQIWSAWQTHLWPQLQQVWLAQSTPATQSLVTTYLNNLAALQSHGANLAASAAQPVLQKALEHLLPYFPDVWQSTDTLSQNLALLTSIPGVTAVAVIASLAPEPLQHRPNLPDVGFLLA